MEGRYKAGQVLALYGKVEEDQYPRRTDDSSAADRGTRRIGRGGSAHFDGDGTHSCRSMRDRAGSAEIERAHVSQIHSCGSRCHEPRHARRVPKSLQEKLGLYPAPGRRSGRFTGPDADIQFSALQAWRTPAHIRLIFEELFFLELGLEIKRRKLRQQPGISFTLDDKARSAVKRILPFHPTAAQKRVLKDIAEDMARPTADATTAARGRRRG